MIVEGALIFISIFSFLVPPKNQYLRQKDI